MPPSMEPSVWNVSPNSASAGQAIDRMWMSASISLSIADSPSCGAAECAARPIAVRRSLNTPRVARASWLSVGSPLIRNAEPGASAFATAAPSLPRSSPTTNSRPTRRSPDARSRSAAATCVARMPFASHDPRP